MKKDTHEYNSLKGTLENDCFNNHHGSAGKMELNYVVRVFERAETSRSVKYTKCISDGDAKTFQAITEGRHYGSDTKEKNIECVNPI